MTPPPQTASQSEPAEGAADPEPVSPSETSPLGESSAAAQQVVTPAVVQPSGPRDWKGFLRFVEERNGEAGVKVGMLHLTDGDHGRGELVVTCKSRTMCEKLTEKTTMSALDALAKEYFGPATEVRVEAGAVRVVKSDKQLMEEAEAHPGVNKVIEQFSAQMISVSARKQ